MELGGVLISGGKFAEALPLFEDSVARFDDVGWRRGFIIVSWGVSRVRMHLARYQEVRVQAQTNLGLAREMGHRWATAGFLGLLGSVALAERAYVEARGWFQESAAVLQEIGQREGLGEAFACLGYVARRSGEGGQAWRHVREALSAAVERHLFLPLITALPAVALLLIDAGDAERALELYSLASCHGYVANSQWFEDVAGKEIAAVAATLPPDVVAAAQDRGRALDLWETAEELLEGLHAPD
jgi:tetratricopeptide (TPR) repeat protein